MGIFSSLKGFFGLVKVVKTAVGKLFDAYELIKGWFRKRKIEKKEEKVKEKQEEVAEQQEKVEDKIEESEKTVEELKEEKENIDPEKIKDKEELRDYFNKL